MSGALPYAGPVASQIQRDREKTERPAPQMTGNPGTCGALRRDLLRFSTEWKDRITEDPAVCHGRACVKGTQVLVSALLENPLLPISVPSRAL